MNMHLAVILKYIAEMSCTDNMCLKIYIRIGDITAEGLKVKYFLNTNRFE